MDKNCSVFHCVLAVFLCVASIAIGFILAFYDVNLSDEPYHMLNFMNVEDSVLAPGASLILGSIGRLFDYQYLGMRFLGVACVNIALVIAGWYYYKQTGNLLEMLYLVAVSALLVNLHKYFWYTMFGWDSICVLMTVVTIVAMLGYVGRPTFIKLCFCVVVVAVTATVRLSNIILYPIFMVVVFTTVKGTYGRKVGLAIGGAIASVLLSVFILSLAYNGIGGYIASMRSLNMQDHSILSLLYINIYHIASYVAICSLFVVAYLVYGCIPRRMIWIGITLAVLELLFLSVTNRDFYYPRIVSSAFISLLVYTAYAKRHCFKDLLSLFVIFACCYITACGSDNGLSKYLALPVVPVLAVYMRDIMNRQLKATLATVVIVLCLIAVRHDYKFATQDKRHPGQFIPLLPDRLSGIRASHFQADYINEIYGALDKYRSEDHRNYLLICPGYERFIWEYIFRYRNPLYSHQFAANDILDDERNMEYVKNELAEDPSLEYVFLITQPGVEDTYFQKEMLSHATILEQTPRYTVYGVRNYNSSFWFRP